MSQLSLQTAAKINLCLRVLGRRTDGYHTVETILHTIGLWDRLHFSPLPEPGRVTIEVQGEPAPADESNLCWRAAGLLSARGRPSTGVAISLEKAIPVGAGLGSGSTNAAAALFGLSRLWGLDLSPGDLEDIAAELGADVPFLLHGGCCLARGRGEKLQPLAPVSVWLVIIVPERRVTTAQAYPALQRGASRGRRRALTRPTQRAIAAVEDGTPQALSEALHNDFESLSIPAIQDSLRAKAALIEAGCLGAGLSGSGSGVFGIAPDRPAADRAAAHLRESWPWVRVSPTIPPGQTPSLLDPAVP